MAALQIEHKIIGLELQHKGMLHSERFELVTIALDQDLRYRGIHYERDEVATRVVELADAVLAKMEKVDEAKQAEDAQRHFATQAAIAKPDTGLPADEIARRARGLAGEVSTGLEGSALGRIRAVIQTRLDDAAKVHADNPTTNVRAQGYREGVSDDRKYILAMIDAEMEKAGPENPQAMSKHERECIETGRSLCTACPGDDDAK